MSVKVKSSIGMTRVHLCYQTPEEYSALSNEEHDELCEWQKENPKKCNCMKHPNEKQLSSVMAKELLELTSNENNSVPSPTLEAIASHLGLTNAPSNPSTLCSILKKPKNDMS